MSKNTRPRVITLSLMGASMFALAACKPEPDMEARVYKDEQSCLAAGDATQDCAALAQSAQVEHQRSAPRYDSLQVCEAEHGAGNCGGDTASSGGGSIFMPLLAGFVAGQVLSSLTSGSGSARMPAQQAREDERRGGGGYIAPVYASRSGGYATADSSFRSNSLSGRSVVKPSTLRQPAATLGKAPMTRATVSSRGGFGSARAGGFGG